MAAMTRIPALDLAGELPAGARGAIQALLEAEPKGARKVYAALARKVWSLLVERRFDDELRDWHELIQSVKAHIRAADGAAAERLAALADLLRESISLAQTSPARTVANRPRARRILEVLESARGFVPRRVLLKELAIGNSHLSNVLTQLVAHDLVDRRDSGKEAVFRITALGRQLIGADGRREIEPRESTVRAARAAGKAAERIGPEQAHAAGMYEVARAQDALMTALVTRVQDAAADELNLAHGPGLLRPGMIIDLGVVPLPGGKPRAYGVTYAEGSHYDGIGMGRRPFAVLSTDYARWAIAGPARRQTALRTG